MDWQFFMLKNVKSTYIKNIAYNERFLLRWATASP